MAGETGGGGGTGRDLPLWAPLILISFAGGDLGDPIYNEKGPFLLLLNCFSAIAIVALVVLGPLRPFGALFLEGPQGLVPSTSEIISPTVTIAIALRSVVGSAFFV